MAYKDEKCYPEVIEDIPVVNESIQLQLDYSFKKNDPSLVRSEYFDSSKIYRPIQYLGAKYRALPILLKKTNEIVKPDTYVLDMFSGSSIVSQCFNLNGLNVVSNDALKFNSTFCKTLLNIGRTENDILGLPVLINKLNSYLLPDEINSQFREAIDYESKLLTERRTEKLLNFYTTFPQIWKADPTNIDFGVIAENFNKPAFTLPALIANFYAGTYFSIFQAIEIDRLRRGIEWLSNSNSLSNWQYNFFLTCLLNVSSKVVYTAGKHFAQPIKPENTLKTDILNQRFFEDRQKNVWSEFEKSCTSLMLIAENNWISKSNLSLSETMENVILTQNNLPKISVVYADPPYTAQQYSRYYHIPEIIYTYCYPKLQLVDGKVTTGLYPDDKYKSRFCSKREAFFAFTDLFKLSSSLNSSLIISYSSSLKEDTGNIRMIALEQIISLGKQYLPLCDIDILKLDFHYRQLNTSRKIIKKKEDKEFLIIFKQPQS